MARVTRVFVAFLAAAMLAVCGFAVPKALADTNANGQSNLVVKVDSGEAPGHANITFSVPSKIVFTAAANGTLSGPTNETYQITNGSMYPIRVSSLRVTPTNGWNIISTDDTTSSSSNMVCLKVGPSDDLLDINDYTEKSNVATQNKWNMNYAGATNNHVTLTTSSGKLKNVTANLTDSETTFATIQWYVTAGNVS